VNRVLSAALLLALCAPVWSEPAADDLVGLSTANGKLAAQMLDLWFNQHRPADAFDQYVSRTEFVNHYGKESPQGFEQTRATEIRITGTDLHFDIRQIIAQGSLVFAHIHVTNGKPGYGGELVEIMRFKDGKVVEHWDIHVPLEQDAAVFFGGH
jgi:predicted SnoaL-like aldol condensation-catalyzing enzyme